MKLSQPQQMMAEDRKIVNEAYAGDIIGVFDPGIFRIGDTLSQGNSKLEFEPIPMFPAEHFSRITVVDTMKRKQFLKGINQLTEEGAIQVFKRPAFGVEELFIGAVGELQFEVLEHRLKYEYGVNIKMQRLPLRYARWVEGIIKEPENLNLTSSTMIVEDKAGRLVLLFENEWSINWALERNENLVLKDIV